MTSLGIEKSHFKSLTDTEKLNFVRWMSCEYNWHYIVGPMGPIQRKWYKGELKK
jgi:hypothetical protein